MDTLQRSDTVHFETANSIIYNLEQKLSFYNIGFFILLLCVAMTVMGFVFYIYYTYD